MELGDKIYNLRKLNGVSQEKLAELTGVSRQTVSKWEAGSVQPSTAHLANLCKIFSLDKDYFYIEEVLTKDDVNSDEIKEIVDEIVCARDRKKSIIGYSVSIPVLAVVLSVLTLITVWFGYASAPEAGVHVSASNYEISYEAFVLMLIATVIVYFIEAVLVVMLIINIRGVLINRRKKKRKSYDKSVNGR